MNGDGHPPAGEAGQEAVAGVPASAKSRDGAAPPERVALVAGAARGGTAVSFAPPADGVQVAAVDVLAGRARERVIAYSTSIADQVLFVVSERARHITMHDIHVDGGATLHA